MHRKLEQPLSSFSKPYWIHFVPFDQFTKRQIFPTFVFDYIILLMVTIQWPLLPTGWRPDSMVIIWGHPRSSMCAFSLLFFLAAIFTLQILHRITVLIHKSPFLPKLFSLPGLLIFSCFLHLKINYSFVKTVHSSLPLWGSCLPFCLHLYFPLFSHETFAFLCNDTDNIISYLFTSLESFHCDSLLENGGFCLTNWESAHRRHSHVCR